MSDGDAVDLAAVADHERCRLPLNHHALDHFQIDAPCVRVRHGRLQLRDGGDVDECLIHRSLRGQFVSFYQQTQDYIDFWTAKDKRTWAELASMYTRWQGV